MVVHFDDMGFKGLGGGNMVGLTEAPRLNHSRSCPDGKRFQEVKFDNLQKESHHHKLDKVKLENNVTRTKRESRSRKLHESLQQEILSLEKRLQSQLEVRRALESALGNGSSSSDDDIDTTSMPKTATDLIREIAVLESEVSHLEQSLVSLNRNATDQQIPAVSPSTMDKKVTATPSASCRIVECSRPPVSSQKDNINIKSRGHLISSLIKDSRIFGGAESVMNLKARRQPAISQHSASYMPMSNPDVIDAKGFRACESQPVSMEYTQTTSGNLVSLAEHLGTRISDHLPKTPNRLSEDMIKCMSAIYCKLSDPPLTHPGFSSSNSTASSMSPTSPRNQDESWSSGLRKDSSFEDRLDNQFHVEDLQEFSGPCSSVVEVPSIYRDKQKLGDVEYLLLDFRSIISRLQKVDPRKLTREEALAFWINIHNSLVMHAFLTFGTPQNNVKRVLLLLKAAYNIGGRTINADTIRSSILRCRMSGPGQWIRKLIPSMYKFKTEDELHAYAIVNPEPLVYFALSSGCHSDPGVRVYTPTKIFQELETAKDEYIRANYGILKTQKLSLPKLVESFSKDSNLSKEYLPTTIQQSLPESLPKSIKKSLAISNKYLKQIEWIPHNFSFRYLISKELVKY
ncbi:unnamed protein product [Rhodiola kirilowii]